MDIITYYLLGVAVNIIGFLLLNDGKLYNGVFGYNRDLKGDDYIYLLIDMLLWPINSVLGIIMGIIRVDLYQILVNTTHLIWPLQVICIIITLIYQKIKKNNQ